MTEVNELMAVQPQGLFVSPIVGMEEAKAKFEAVRKFTAKCLTEGVDYGTFTGVSKPSLLKPGAEKLGTLFGLNPKFKQIDKVLNWTGEGNPDNEPFFYFEYKCGLYRNGEHIAECDASCNSWEKKYRYRRGELVCPNCGKPLRKSKNGDGYYCWAKQGGCGATFQSNDPRVTSQKVGDVKNFDTAEQVNTFQKMAQKRAYIGAILIACNLSEYFTQDIEDMAGFAVSADAQPMMDGDYTPVQDAPKPQQSTTQPAQKPAFDEIAYLKSFSKPSWVQGMSKTNAEKMQDRDGNEYGKKSTYELKYMLKSIITAMENATDDPEKQAAYGLKAAAICEILQNRKIEKTMPKQDEDPFVPGEKEA